MTTTVKLPHAVSAIAGVAIDQLHELTIQQIDQWTEVIRQKLGASTAPAPTPVPAAAPAPTNGARVNGSANAVAAPAAAPTTSSQLVSKGLPLMIGAIIGAVVAATVIERMKSAPASAAGEDEEDAELEAHHSNSEDEA